MIINNQSGSYAQVDISDYEIIFQNSKEIKIFKIDQIIKEEICFTYENTDIRITEALDQNHIVSYWRENPNSKVTIIRDFPLVQVYDGERKRFRIKYTNVNIEEIKSTIVKNEVCLFELSFKV